jgi:hypothetical protein
MIKKRGLPLVTGVARFTLASPRAKLIRVWIIVAFAAFYGGFSEIHVTHVEFQVWRFVTIGAGRSAMRSDQRERRMRMIELRQILPFFCGVARLAPEHSASSIARRHTLSKLALMHVLMAGDATQLVKVIQRYFRADWLVALVASHGSVSPG